MLWHPKDIQLTQSSLMTEGLQGVSNISSTDISMFSSKIEMGHPSSEPDDGECSGHPRQSLGKARQKKVNCGVIIATPRRQSTLTQLLESWKVPRDSKADSHNEQHPARSLMIADT